ncbi:hypothetical protein MNBD_NITROSPIRAE03-963, partial [hydrothermal vent metagenome]
RGERFCSETLYQKDHSKGFETDSFLNTGMRETWSDGVME